jgi:integrase
MGRFEQVTGHLQVKADKGARTRSYYAYWRDATGRHGRRLGPAHVKDSGRRTPRGATVWRAGDGPRPSQAHLTPKDAEVRLQQILREADDKSVAIVAARATGTLRRAAEGWVAERSGKVGLKRSTLAVYENMFERMCRDLGGEAPVTDLTVERLRDYFATFQAERALGDKRAAKLRSEGVELTRVEIEGWVAQPPGCEPIEVPRKAEAVTLARQLGGKWKHERPGVYRVVPGGWQRARRVSWAKAKTLRAQGWLVSRRATRRWTVRTPPSAQTHNKYRATLGAALDYAVRQGWLETNPITNVDSASNKAARSRVLRREDYYHQAEVEQLLEHTAGDVERAFWLCGAHAGLRLPGEALGLRWGAVDLDARILRPYGNWVNGYAENTKTTGFAPIPMTPSLTNALAALRRRGYCLGDGDFVFAGDSGVRPLSPDGMRESFRRTREAAGLKPIPMYNLRHSFGTNLASAGIDVRTIQALMRHNRLGTTEQYMAYAPQPDLASQLTRALDSQAAPTTIDPWNVTPVALPAALVERLEEEIPSKWVQVLRQLYTEAGVPLMSESTALSDLDQGGAPLHAMTTCGPTVSSLS